jgi:hypothetical protein
VEVRSIVEKAFLREWRTTLRGRQLTDSDLSLIAENFNLPRVRREILVEARRMTPTGEQRAARRHRVALRGLARQYAHYLYRASQRGTELDEDAILEAKRLLRSAPKCPVYPCG